MTASGPPADDATLVAGVLAGDRRAFAGVYERYADRLHDFAYSMLRSREEAADCVADAFVVMAEKVGQLRDPARLRPWLYSVVRNECLRTLRGRAREAHDDEWLEAMPDHGAGPEQQVADAAVQDELRELVWAAIEGLNDRDRSLLDLHLRQGLDGAELAAAMEVTPQNSYVMLSRARDQVERSLGALLVARRGSELCGELSGILGDWDGRFSPLIRKRVARHIDGCETCETRRRLMVSPLALLAGVPAFAAPAALRDRVLGDERLVAHYVDDPAPPPPSSGSGTTMRPSLVVGLVVLLLALGGAAVLAWWPEDTAPAVATDPVTTEPVTGSPTPPTTGPAATAPAPATTPTEPAPPHGECAGRPSVDTHDRGERRRARRPARLDPQSPARREVRRHRTAEQRRRHRPGLHREAARGLAVALPDLRVAGRRRRDRPDRHGRPVEPGRGQQHRHRGRLLVRRHRRPVRPGHRRPAARHRPDLRRRPRRLLRPHPDRHGDRRLRAAVGPGGLDRQQRQRPAGAGGVRRLVEHHHRAVPDRRHGHRDPHRRRSGRADHDPLHELRRRPLPGLSAPL
ncbi:sigma-70 family RNA polymerase sigma factor [Nocardioides sp. L-11A]|nr:sigma-70 family RNA polymerase sigma factor [Nocardioides sp. L-11A]